MKARLVPLYFPNWDEDFDKQLAILRRLLAEECEFLEPVALGSPLPEAEAVLFPQMLGDAYRMLDAFKTIDRPILIITSEFGTVLMWDWEIVAYLRSAGVETIAPPSLEQSRKVCRALGIKRELRDSRFLVFQDNPGEGFQAEIFKRFYWWEAECIQRMQDKFGVTIDKQSFEKLATAARQIPDEEAAAVWQTWQSRLNLGDISQRQLYSALKLYLAVKRELDQRPDIKSVGINCLNESRYSDTTPCLAWNMLYEEMGLIWGCEADIVAMLTKYIIHKSLGVPIMMTNIYPFLMGQAALKHERIPNFPPVEGNPDDYILVAHCGYLGVLPVSFSSEWTLRDKVLAIVDDNATVIDARLPEGDITLAKLHPSFEKITIAEGQLVGYTQYPGSDCRNGGVIRISDGHKLLDTVTSHHYLLMTGHHLVDLKNLGKVFGLESEVI